MNDGTDDVVGRLVHDESPNSIGDQLAAKRKNISENRETYIPIPGYDREAPILLARYRLLEGPELSRIGDKVRRDSKNKWERQIHAQIDMFVAACLGLYVDLDDGNPPKPLTYEGEPVMGFNEDLAKALGFRSELPDPATARSVVYGLFVKNDVAISTHGYMLNRWFSDTSLDVSQEFSEGNL